MSSPLYISPAVLEWVTANLDSIGASLASSHAAAAGPTTGLAAAAADEVSEAVASLFGQHAGGYQSLAAKAAAFHDQFTQNMAASGVSYQAAEAAAMHTLQNVASAPAAAF